MGAGNRHLQPHGSPGDGQVEKVQAPQEGMALIRALMSDECFHSNMKRLQKSRSRPILLGNKERRCDSLQRIGRNLGREVRGKAPWAEVRQSQGVVCGM